MRLSKLINNSLAKTFLSLAVAVTPVSSFANDRDTTLIVVTATGPNSLDIQRSGTHSGMALLSRLMTSNGHLIVQFH